VARLEQAEDAAAEGRKICIETIEELSLIPGVAGAHIMAPGNDRAIPEVIAAVRRTVTMAARAG
jgi:methylenetetrahydrofolate reductase (NADPH)